MQNTRLKLLPPWTIFIKKVEALFDGDPQIACNVNYSGTAPSIVLSCNNGDKVSALQMILPEGIEYGGVTLNIEVDGIPSNRAFMNKKELFDVAFAGNPAYAYSICPVDEGYQWFAATYVVFKNYVVQFFADNLNDCHGIISTLYQNIADEILTGPAVNGVYFNTDVEVGKLGMATEEWL